MHTTWNCIELQIFPQVNQMWFEKNWHVREYSNFLQRSVWNVWISTRGRKAWIFPRWEGLAFNDKFTLSPWLGFCGSVSWKLNLITDSLKFDLWCNYTMIDSRGFAFKMAAEFHCLFFRGWWEWRKGGDTARGWVITGSTPTSTIQCSNNSKFWKNKEKSTFSFHYSLIWHISFSTSKA